MVFYKIINHLKEIRTTRYKNANYCPRATRSRVNPIRQTEIVADEQNKVIDKWLPVANPRGPLNGPHVAYISLRILMYIACIERGCFCH